MNDAEIAELRETFATPDYDNSVEACEAINRLLDEIERIRAQLPCRCDSPELEQVAVVGRGVDLLCTRCNRFFRSLVTYEERR